MALRDVLDRDLSDQPLSFRCRHGDHDGQHDLRQCLGKYWRRDWQLCGYPGDCHEHDQRQSGDRPGGAIYNSAYDANLTNVTISGNRGMNGGGIFNVGSGSTVRLSNVTIFNNLARYEGSNPNLGAGGGVVNQSSATMLVANTIIAGNVAGSGSGPDCDAAGAQAALTSQGYNLLQSASFCTVGGNVTGNVVGRDPLLTPLEDNGGFTLTHALAPGSPAIDTGSTVLPGSGGGACALADQRGVLRPLGARCDMGAFERDAAFTLGAVRPASGGNTGQVTIHATGSGFSEGASLLLRR